VTCPWSQLPCHAGRMSILAARVRARPATRGAACDALAPSHARAARDVVESEPQVLLSPQRRQAMRKVADRNARSAARPSRRIGERRFPADIMRLPALFHAALTSLACAALASCSTFDDPARDHGAPGSLRAAIFDRYEQLARSNGLPLPNTGYPVDFSDVVSPFLEPSATLEDAAAVLKEAGFAVLPLPPRPLTGDSMADHDRGLLVASLLVQTRLFWRADLACNMPPTQVMHDVRVAGHAHCWLTTSAL